MFLDKEIIDELLQKLQQVGLKLEVPLNIKASERKKDLGFRLSITPKNSYYTNRTHIQNENYDKIFDENSELFFQSIKKMIVENEYVTFPSEQWMINFIKNTKLAEFVKNRGCPIVHIEISDAYIIFEFEEPSEKQNYGYKKHYKPTENEIKNAKKIDDYHRI